MARFIEAIKSIFVSSVPSEYAHGFSRSNSYLNISRAKTMSLLILVIELSVLLLTFIPSIATLFGSYLLTYRWMYVFIIVAVLLTYLAIRFLKSHVGKLHVIELAAFVFLQWCVLLTILDALRGIQSGVYYFIAMALSIVVVLKPSKSLRMYGISFILYIILSFVILKDSTLVFSNVINGLSFIITTWIISIIVYRLRGRDYTKQQIIEEQNQQLSTMANMDHLSGINNRRTLDDQLLKLYQQGLENQTPLSVMMIDIDEYKSFNDTYGHIKGDHVLKAIASRIEMITNVYSSQAFRYGGDEFCVLIPEISVDQLKNVVKELFHSIEIMQIENEASKYNRYLTISVGIFNKVPSAEDKPWDFIDQADKDLYISKKKRVKNETKRA